MTLSLIVSVPSGGRGPDGAGLLLPPTHHGEPGEVPLPLHHHHGRDGRLRGRAAGRVLPARREGLRQAHQEAVTGEGVVSLDHARQAVPRRVERLLESWKGVCVDVLLG